MSYNVCTSVLSDHHVRQRSGTWHVFNGATSRPSRPAGNTNSTSTSKNVHSPRRFWFHFPHPCSNGPSLQQDELGSQKSRKVTSQTLQHPLCQLWMPTKSYSECPMDTKMYQGPVDSHRWIPWLSLHVHISRFQDNAPSRLEFSYSKASHIPLWAMSHMHNGRRTTLVRFASTNAQV
jgi:hypothetical protein